MKYRESGVFAPSYYNNFKCIADKCRHSCCIDWEIYIDDCTFEKYKRMGDILPTVKNSEDGPCFALTAGGRCPHLNDKGLCDIIINHGEEYLSEICREHPRFYNFVANGIEVGLGLVCEEACRLILEDDSPFTLVKIEDMEECGDGGYGFNPLPHRDRIISAIGSSGRFSRKVFNLKTEFCIPEICTSHQWLERLLSLEILDNAWVQTLKSAMDEPFETDKSFSDYEKYYCRLLTYFVYRHVSTADSEENLRARLGFAILSSEVIRWLFERGEEQSLQALVDIARRYSAEIEYSEDNTEELIFAFEREIQCLPTDKF